jgi:lipopolysaccharide heptosyltransferase III
MSQPDAASFYNRTQSARKIIVVDLGFLGDSVHLVPALWEIKRHYPAAELHVLSAPVGSEVVKMAQCVDRAWTFPLGPPSPAWWRHWDILRALRRQKFDLAFNFSAADRTIVLTALTGAKWRLAYAGGRHHFWNRWLIKNWIPTQVMDCPVFEQRRWVLAACGLQLQAPRFDLRPSAADLDWAEANIPAGSIHISINATTPLNEWPLENAIEFVKLLLKENPSLTVLASASLRTREQERMKRFAADVNHPRLKVLPAGLAIPQLAAALERCQLHVGANSGVIHLALAFDVPTLSFFRESVSRPHWLPRGTRHWNITVDCACLNQKKAACLATGRAACLLQVSPASVQAIINQQFATLRGLPA